MADGIEAAGLISERSRKRKRLGSIPKLLTNQKVEVRSIEEGFEGSWHCGTVIDAKTQICVVKYDHILLDDGSDKFVDSIPVTSMVNGKFPSKLRNYRGRIRPLPPKFNCNGNCLHYGQCVDVFHQDAWWEGVIFDHDDMSDKRSVFFPDVGDELRVSIENLRFTRDWNAASDEWKLRGDWIFLEVLEELELEKWPLFISVKQIWYEARIKKRFLKEMKEWTCQMREIWKETVKEVIIDNFKLTMAEFFGRLQQGGHILDINKRFLDSMVDIEPSFFESLAAEPFDPNHVALEEELDDNDDDDAGPPGFSNLASTKSENEVLSSRSEDICYQWTQMSDLCVAERDLVLEPECCPDSIFQYNEYTKGPSKPPGSLIVKVRQHLLYLGWKIELKRDPFGSKKSESIRYRYTSPGRKHYFSLTVLCADLCNCSSEYTSLGSYKPPPRDLLEVEPEYCPQAVVDYYSVMLEGNSEFKKKDIGFRDMQSRARKHLLAVGWVMSFADELCKRFVYLSPSGKKCYSLRQACNHYILESFGHGSYNASEINVSEQSEGESRSEHVKKGKNQGVGKLIIKKKDGVLCIEAAPSLSSTKRAVKKNGSLLNSIDEENGNSSTITRVLRSSKRAREEISPMHQTPRTVLSWLMDNNVIVPRSKVQYRCRKDGHTMKEGRVTRDGIKCSCCQTVFSVSKFESHAGSTYRRPSANIFLEDGRSLLDCQLQIKGDQNARLCMAEPRRLKGSRRQIINDNDYICSVCHYGGELVLCDQCPSSFHTHCLGLKVPDGDWFCPSCCCRICNQNKYGSDCEQTTDSNVLSCEQCERRYHIGCLKGKEGFMKLESYPPVNWFCCLRCKEIFMGINKLLGKPIPVGRDDLTWTILKHKKPEGTNHDMEELTESYSKLNIAISVMHECFEPVKEPRTQRDIVEDVIFCRWSELNRLNFKGFYTVLLEKDDELVSAATIRFRYRRCGMCHALMNELEKMLVELGVERLVLPAVPSVLHTWTSSFGFSLMTESEKLNFLGYTFLDFQGTQMCQKRLVRALPSAESSISRGVLSVTSLFTMQGFISKLNRNNFAAINGSNAADLEGISAVTEVSQAERFEETVIEQQQQQQKVSDSTFGLTR
ncbi:Agenet-like domain-containing protein, partial [Cynara cardunculus var. scolymus]